MSVKVKTNSTYLASDIGSMNSAMQSLSSLFLESRQKHKALHIGHSSGPIPSSILLSGREKLNKMVVFPQTSHWENWGSLSDLNKLAEERREIKSIFRAIPDLPAGLLLHSLCFPGMLGLNINALQNGNKPSLKINIKQQTVFPRH